MTIKNFEEKHVLSNYYTTLGMVKRKNAFRELKFEDMVEIVGENHYIYRCVEVEERGMCEWCQETDKYL